jgi:hypothetical protein
MYYYRLCALYRNPDFAWGKMQSMRNVSDSGRVEDIAKFLDETNHR